MRRKSVSILRFIPNVEVFDKDIKGFLKELQAESDRAVAILSGALLDQLLRDLLEAFLIDDEKAASDCWEQTRISKLRWVNLVPELRPRIQWV